MTEIEEKLYGIAGGEVASKKVKPGVWSKAYSSALGDEAKTKAIYIQLRVDQLRAQAAAESQHVTGREQEQSNAICRKLELLRGVRFEDTDHISSEQFTGTQSSLISPVSVSRAAGLVGLLEFQIVDLIKRGYLHGVFHNDEWYFDVA